MNAAHTIEKKNVPLVIDGEVFPGSGIPLYFLDGVEDLPYVDLKEFTDGLNTWFADSVTGFMWYEDEESGLGTITYMSNDSMLGFDFTDQSVYYTSFETFGAEPGRYLLDMLSFSGTNSDTGEPELFERVNVFPPERKGSMREILLGDYDLYCLISPESFSAGNLLPWVFKTSDQVTLMGSASGGGSCEVLPLTTAWAHASMFPASGACRLLRTAPSTTPTGALSPTWCSTGSRPSTTGRR